MTKPFFHKCEIPIASYNLGLTLNSGQAFRWEEVLYEDGIAWEGAIGSRWTRVYQRDVSLCIESVCHPGNWGWARDYFHTKLDYNSILASFPNDAFMQESLDSCQGLRLLNQDPWETLASFILSSNKQISHIRQMIKAICFNFGTQLEGVGGRYGFPSPEILSEKSESQLRNLKLGYRAPYLLAASRAIASGSLNLSSLYSMTSSDARDQLMQLPGVGPKVADCVLLFGFGKYDVFPIDTWIKRVLIEQYGISAPHSMKNMQVFAEQHFGVNRGYAQQFLFQWGRTK